MRVLVVNAGSSSLKLSLLEAGSAAPVWSRALPAGAPLELPGEPPAAVGHRVVHGGTRYRSAVRLDEAVKRHLAELTDLAPLHEPAALAGIEAAERALPGVPQVACFDTAFHATLPEAAATYALPREWRERFALRRYGFHGLSHASATRRAGEMLGDPHPSIVTCHLGAGASLAAVRGGRCVDTTMGFTPLEGLVMATRSGSVDPGLLVWLLQHGGLGVDELSHGLEHESGLRGLAGTGDMRALLEREDDAARLAIAVYEHRLITGIGAMAAAAGGLQALVFTGGVGENAARLRADVVAALAHLGVSCDPERNSAHVGGDADLSVAGDGPRTLVIQAREDLEIARQVRTELAPGIGSR